MKKFNLSKLIIIALIIVIAAMSAIIVSAKNFKTDKNPAAMTQTINDGTGFVDQVISAPIHFVQDKVNVISNLMDTYKQNESLKTQLSALTDEKNKLTGVESENKELKTALKLQQTLTDYETVSSNVITRNPASWNDTLVIDRGSDDGIKNNMPVMANGGLIGRVSQVNKSTAKVSLLSSSKGIENKIPVYLSSNGSPSYGILSSYDSTQNAYVVSQVTTTTKFAKGSQVFTSGLGGGVGSVRDLLVGTVIGEKNSNDGLDRQIYIKPASNLYDIRFVFVVKQMIGGN
ncbi:MULTISPECIES: rod shape-determining protein MreC [unclassified Lactococcus]|uniref:rod shape-determining protein MreC n=1 Tax=unclassified Lactococcus TaxID=2643510 RepID=UPI0011CBEFC9|nr:MULTISPECIES: rod shape-determining protein MreC [unclassified Lactococcus]MQW23052.1 rod shape-determining protein MreC [Lactococcus sp. dk101]TXK44397.1 rod shape-determining protein MreC [Lactococcus sp. dk310]TXK50207.1 rod shape-determining protein MreC [Lactococcus sp. dk322]